jgi:beta-lactamase class A
MTETSDEENETTAKDIGIFFEKLWKGNLISEENKNEMIKFLTNTDFEDHIASGLPSDISLSHKYGREVHVVNDAGIVLTDNPFVVVIMSKGVVEKEADEVFPTLSKLVFEGMDN